MRRLRICWTHAEVTGEEVRKLRSERGARITPKNKKHTIKYPVDVTHRRWRQANKVANVTGTALRASNGL